MLEQLHSVKARTVKEMEEIDAEIHAIFSRLVNDFETKVNADNDSIAIRSLKRKPYMRETVLQYSYKVPVDVYKVWLNFYQKVLNVLKDSNAPFLIAVHGGIWARNVENCFKNML